MENSAPAGLRGCVAALLIGLGGGWGSFAAAADDAVMKEVAGTVPALGALYRTYEGREAVGTLREYAERQGFNGRFEKAAVVLHELIHVESARLGSYWIGGQAYNGYALDWRGVTAKQGAAAVGGEEERKALAAVEVYVAGAGNNHLGNILDEINAYGQTVGIVCRLEPANAGKHVAVLKGHLVLANGMLRGLRIADDGRWKAWHQDGGRRGIVEMIVARGYKALGECGERTMDHQEEIIRFLK